jgi:hypothetical protein
MSSVSITASAQAIWIAPAWQPLPALRIVTPVPPMPMRPPAPVTLERFYFIPSPPAEDRPPQHSTESPAAPTATARGANEIVESSPIKARPRIVIREYYLPEQSIEREIRQVPIPTELPRPLQAPPWSDDMDHRRTRGADLPL